MSLDYKKILSVAKTAALQAGNYLKENFEDKPKIEFKGEIDLITERDRKSQEIVYNIIHDNFKDHSILGEEGMNIKNKEEFLWIVDPLDGTTNYAHSLPYYCVSIAFEENKETKAGVVFNPMLNELFWAIKGEGAYLNGKRLKVSKEFDLNKSLLATGFPYDLRESSVNNLEYFTRFLFKVQAIRRCGSAALDLAYLAAGIYDGFWELKLNPWDTAASALFVEEAGGTLTDFKGNPYNPYLKECLATNGIIHNQMLDILKGKKDGK